MTAHVHPQPIGGRLLARPMPLLLVVFAASVAVIIYRFFAGIGAVSNMSDGFTWGIWEPINVVVFTGIGTGALAVGLLTYLLDRGEYHALVRPTVLLGAICYSLGGASIMVALGRYWNALLLPVVPYWNLGSALLEVAVCVLAYIMVLWVEVVPAVLDRVATVRSPRWSSLGRRWGARLEVAMPFVISLAMVLPIMHQSSLGGLMLLAETKVHPLWHTALLPALFLISCLSMGYGAVVVLVTSLSLGWRAQRDQALFAGLSKMNAGFLVAYVVLRVGDLAWSGKLHLLGLDLFTGLLLLELALFVAPAVMLLWPSVRLNWGRTLGAALLAIAGGALYRVDTYISVYRPGPGWRYSPSLGEIVVTLGMAALGVALFIFVCRLLPVVTLERPSHDAAPPLAATGTSGPRPGALAGRAEGGR